MDEVKRHAKEKECESLQLEVYAQNNVALKFYEKNGFIAFAEDGDWEKMEYLF